MPEVTNPYEEQFPVQFVRDAGKMRSVLSRMWAGGIVLEPCLARDWGFALRFENGEYGGNINLGHGDDTDDDGPWFHFWGAVQGDPLSEYSEVTPTFDCLEDALEYVLNSHPRSRKSDSAPLRKPIDIIEQPDGEGWVVYEDGQPWWETFDTKEDALAATFPVSEFGNPCIYLPLPDGSDILCAPCARVEWERGTDFDRAGLTDPQADGDVCSTCSEYISEPFCRLCGKPGENSSDWWQNDSGHGNICIECMDYMLNLDTTVPGSWTYFIATRGRQESDLEWTTIEQHTQVRPDGPYIRQTPESYWRYKPLDNNGEKV